MDNARIRGSIAFDKLHKCSIYFSLRVIMVSGNLDHLEPSNLGLRKSIFQSIPAFDELTEDESEILAQHVDIRTVPARSLLCSEGHRGEALYYIINGKVEIWKKLGEDRRHILALCSSGASVGEMSLIEESPRSATVTVLEDSEVLVLTKNDFDIILAKYPSLGIKILKNIAKSLSHKIRNTSEQLTADSGT